MMTIILCGQYIVQQIFWGSGGGIKDKEGRSLPISAKQKIGLMSSGQSHEDFSSLV
jgi:hypothetical protein